MFKICNTIYDIFSKIRKDKLIHNPRLDSDSEEQLANTIDAPIVISCPIYGHCEISPENSVTKQNKCADWWLEEELTKHDTNEIVSAIEGEKFGSPIEPKATANGAKTWQEKISEHDPSAILHDIKAMYDKIKRKLEGSQASDSCKCTLALPSKTWDAIEAEHAAKPEGSVQTLLQNDYPDLKIVALPDLETDHGTYAIFVCDDPAKLNAAYFVYEKEPQVVDTEYHHEPLGYRQLKAFARVNGLCIINPARVAVMKGV